MSHKQNRPSGLIGLLLAGILLPAFPALAMTMQYQRLHTGTPLQLNVASIQTNQGNFIPTYEISTPLNHISTSQLTGENSFVLGDRVFVFLSPGPDMIWYPYAISKRAPDPGCEPDHCLIIKGRVTDIARDSLKIAYAFESVPVSLHGDAQSDMETAQQIEVMVNPGGDATLRKIIFANGEIDQRNLFRLAPPGISNLGANTTPATAPPK